MLRRARTIGIVIAAIGVAVLIGFGSVAIRDTGDFSKAKLLRERNPGGAGVRSDDRRRGRHRDGRRSRTRCRRDGLTGAGDGCHLRMGRGPGEGPR